MSVENINDARSEPVYAVERELTARIHAVVMEYAGCVSTVAAIGILELVKITIAKDTP